MLDAVRRPAARGDLDLHPTSALGTESRRLEFRAYDAGGVLALGKGFTALTAVGDRAHHIGCRVGRHSVLASSLIGIFSSDSNARSSSASRPSVVR